jgi:hypothetical protein
MAMTPIPYFLEFGMKESIDPSRTNVNLRCCEIDGKSL